VYQEVFHATGYVFFNAKDSTIKKKLAEEDSWMLEDT